MGMEDGPRDKLMDGLSQPWAKRDPYEPFGSCCRFPASVAKGRNVDVPMVS